MNPISMAGAFVVTFALLSYGIGCISLQRFKVIKPGVLIFLSVGIFLDAVAAVLMIIGSESTPFTLDGFLDYSALLVMLIVVILIWRVHNKKGMHAKVGTNLLLYTKAAFGWWVVAYITGSLIVIL